MAQVSYGTITVSDLTDITDVYLEYAKVVDTVIRYQDIPSTTEWSKTYPEWESGYQIWIRQVTKKEGLPDEYGTPYLDKAVNQINNRISVEEATREALASRLKKIWINEETHGDYVAGTYAASGIENITFNETNPQTFGYNTLLRHNKLALRYNTIDMTTLTTGTLIFYRPAKDSSNNYIQGKKGLELNADSLIFYKPLAYNAQESETAAAILNSTGLNISDGTIDLTSGVTDRVHLSTRNLSEAATINGESTVDWRLILGDKFGVTKAGYMNAGSGKIGGLILEQNSIHSNEKNLNNEIAGLYMDSSGQFNIGTRNRHVKFWNEDVSIESDTISLTNITLDKETFLNRINYQSNTYSFIYYNSKWKLDLNEVSLADYGISINGVTLKNNDTIRITYQPNNWKIDIQANKLSFSSGINVEEELITTQNISKVISGYNEINYEINESSNIKEVDIDEELFISKVGNYGTYDFIFRNDSWTLFNIIKSSSIIQLENIILDRDAFITKVGSDNANYLFAYHDQKWILNEQVVDLKDYGLDVKPVRDGEDLSEGDNFTISCSNDIVNLSQYGITYDSTQLPVNGDVIKVFYSQIEGLEGQITNIQEITQSAIDNANKAELAADNAIEIASELSGETIGSENIIIKTIGIPLDNVSLDKPTFLDKIERQQNVYNFVFSDGSWDLTKKEDTSTTPTQNDLVILEQYGITISGDYTLQENDSIEITYEGFMPFSQLNNSISNLDDKLNQAILDSVERSTTKSDELTNSIAQLRSDFENEKQEREARITFGLDGNFPIMTLAGGKENPDLSITITNSELDFLDKGNIVAFISGQLLNINNAKVLSNLQFGDFAFIPRENGNFCLKYLGTGDA